MCVCVCATIVVFLFQPKCIATWTGFSQKPSFRIAISGRAGVGRVSGGRRALSQVNLLVNIFSKLSVIFILQWIAFIFGRDEEEDQ